MQPYIPEIPFSLITAFALVSAAVAAWRGGPDAMLVAGVFLVQVALPWLPGQLPIWVLVTEDVVTLAICLGLVLVGRHAWTIFAAASQVLSLATQALHATIGLSAWSYYSAQITWLLVLIGSVLVGSLLSPRSAKTTRGP